MCDAAAVTRLCDIATRRHWVHNKKIWVIYKIGSTSTYRILQCRQRRIELWLHITCVEIFMKFGRGSSRCVRGQIHMQTDPAMDTVITFYSALLPGKSNHTACRRSATSCDDGGRGQVLSTVDDDRHGISCWLHSTSSVVYSVGFTFTFTFTFTELNVTAHVFCDYNRAIILIFALLEVWLSSRSYRWL